MRFTAAGGAAADLKAATPRRDGVGGRIRKRNQGQRHMDDNDRLANGTTGLPRQLRRERESLARTSQNGETGLDRARECTLASSQAQSSSFFDSSWLSVMLRLATLPWSCGDACHFGRHLLPSRVNSSHGPVPSVGASITLPSPVSVPLSIGELLPCVRFRSSFPGVSP